MSDPQERLEHILDVLRRQGHRITPQRLAILRILADSQGHPSADNIFEQVRADFPTTSLATVYKTITVLKDLGELLELGFADWGSRYDGHNPHPHPHVICTRCGAISDPPFAGMAELARQMAATSGYQITHHRLDFFGLCPACRDRAEN